MYIPNESDVKVRNSMRHLSKLTLKSALLSNIHLHPFWWSTFEQEDNYNLNRAQLSQLNIQKKVVWATEHIWAQTQWFP